MQPTETSPLTNGAAHDVIVVGAGPAGAATAMLLARRALRTLLLDDRTAVADADPPPALMRGGVLQLSRWGLLDDVIAAGTPPVRRVTSRYGDETITVSIKPSHEVGALYAPHRAVLDRLLVRAAIDAGAELHEGTSVTDVIVDDKRVTGVRASTADNPDVELPAPLVIGADGMHSTVARHVGATYSKAGSHAAAMTYAYWPAVVTDGYQWQFRPNACAGLIPTNEGRACVFASATPDYIGDGGVDAIRDIVGECAPELAARLRDSPPDHGATTWRGHHGYLRRSSGPGWALVGDAGFFTDPIGMRGLTDALRDAELLARAAVEGLSGDSTLDDALAGYERARNRLALPLLDVIDRIASQQWDSEQIAQLQQRLSSAMADEVDALTSLDPGVAT